MYCENCGTQIGENDKFCQNCGKPVGTGAGESPSVTDQSYSGENDNGNLYSCNSAVVGSSAVNEGFVLKGWVLNKIAAVIAILGFFIGISAGGKIGSVTSYFSDGSEFNVAAMLVVWVITVFLVIANLWMGAVLTRLENIESKLGGNGISR